MKVLPIAILCGLFFGALGALSVTWAVLCIARGDFITAVVLVGAAAFCIGFIIPFAKIVPGKVRPRGQVDHEGTTIRPDRGIDIPVQVSLFGLFLAGGLFAVFAPLGKLDIPVPHEMRFYLPFVGAVAAITTAPILVRNLRRGSTKYLRMTPGGFELVQGWQPRCGDWAQVVDVTDEAPSQSAATPNAIVVVMSDGSAPTMAAASFTPDGRALRELVRFYWQHSERRGELTDGQALQRLRDEPFEVDRK
jgi:hypothetical protein